jgi:chromosome segregation ATPase
LDSQYSDASSSRKEVEVDECEDAVDNIIETGMAQDRGSPLRHTRRRMAGELEAIKRMRDALKREAEELRDQCRSALALKEHVDKVTVERDALILEAELKAETTENITKERDALRLEAEELRAHYEESRKLEDQLNFQIQKYKDITGERDALLLKAQIKAADKDTLNEVRDALELETQSLLDQRKAAKILKEQLNFVRLQCNDIEKETDSFKLGYRRSEEDCNAVRKFTESLKVEIEKLRPQLEDYDLLREKLNSEILKRDDVAKERDSCKLKHQLSGRDNRAIREVMEALKRETEEIRAKFKNFAVLKKQLNTERQQCENIEEERNAYKLRAQQIAESRDDIKTEMDALKLETQNLRAKILHTDMLEKEIKAVMLQYDNIKTEAELYKLKAQKQQGVETS